MLLLAVDGHVHLDDQPPGKRLLRRGRTAFEGGLRSDAQERQRRLAASLRRLRRDDADR